MFSKEGIRSMSADTSLWTRVLRSTPGRYSIALVVTALVLLARRLLDPFLRDSGAYTTLYPGIAFLAIYVGLGPSSVSAVLGLIGANYWFVSTRGALTLWDSAMHVIGALTFLTACACIIALGEASRRSRTRLQRTEKLFDAFLDNSPGAEYLKDEDGMYVYVNKTTGTRFSREFIGKTDEELFPDRDSEQWRSNDLRVLRENKALEFIETTHGPEGERTWLSLKFPVTDAEGRTLLGGKSFDITGQKKAEEKLKDLSAQLQRFLNTVPSGLARCGRDLRFRMVNPAYAQIVGLPVEQIIGRRVPDVIGARGWEIIQPYVERALRGERMEYQSELPFASGGTRHIHVIYTPDTDSSGQVVGWVASITDITESKTIEAQLQKVEKLAAAGQLAASLAHEINNPLSSVTNALYLLSSSSDLDAPASRLVAMAESELARVARIVKQSLSYHRAGKAPRQLDLGAVVQESLQIFREKFHRYNIELTKKIAPETLITGFADEIRQVIDNLLLNALEATPSGGRVTVSVHRSRNWKSRREGVRLTIGDTGHGIPRQKLTSIFEPFFTTKDEKGTGLGLWVVSGIVAKHDGSIKVRSAASGDKSGTVISILWPSTGQTQGKADLAKTESAA
jgi:PAS domain S-box-containing protein